VPSIGPKKERRRHARKPLNKSVPILCEDEFGRERLLQARLIDVSVSGAKILTPVKLAARSLVTFNCIAMSVGGRGTVRYCNPTKGGYEIGLELANGTGWRDQNTDLRNLAAGIGDSAPVTESAGDPASLPDLRKAVK
jgi:hypothetical protein